MEKITLKLRLCRETEKALCVWDQKTITYRGRNEVWVSKKLATKTEHVKGNVWKFEMSTWLARRMGLIDDKILPIVINFSGGRTSGYMLKMILDQHGGTLPDNYIVLFQNTGKEDEATLLYVKECGEKWGVQIIWLEYDRCDDGKVGFKVVDFDTASRKGEPFEQLIFGWKNPYLPNQDHRICTIELKLRTVKRYMVSLGHKQWHHAVGIRADETHRASKTPDPRVKPFYPLIENNIYLSDITEYWSKSNFDLQLSNPALGNCTGCFLKSEKTRAWICKNRPQDRDWWMEMEERANATFTKDRSWKELNDFVQRQGEFNFDDDNQPYCNSVIGAGTDF
jgi:3'-phosphoadenosine 5'-phosphosulfate sulfotransferase (PAPS reductase)/FAD synthetase